MDYYDAELSPRPDRHGDFAYPIDSSSDVLPRPDIHGMSPYPINDDLPHPPPADKHENTDFPMHTGKTPFDHNKPGSFK